MEASLRQRIRGAGIKCTPWRNWEQELDYLPISSKTLFKNDGVPIDILERELKFEKWLFEEEELLEVLKIEDNLRRKHLREDHEIEENIFDDSWSDEDYEAFYSQLGRFPDHF